MKKIFGLIIAVILSTSCDDGEITLKSFDFEAQTIQKCSNKTFLFKTKSQELLLLYLPEATFNTAFENVETGNTPRTVEINSNNVILYRRYADDITSAVVCSDLAPAAPLVEKEWSAVGGIISIETVSIYASDGITITGYNHTITFKNTSFINTDESFSLLEYKFGDYKTTL